MGSGDPQVATVPPGTFTMPQVNWDSSGNAGEPISVNVSGFRIDRQPVSFDFYGTHNGKFETFGSGGFRFDYADYTLVIERTRYENKMGPHVYERFKQSGGREVFERLLTQGQAAIPSDQFIQFELSPLPDDAAVGMTWTSAQAFCESRGMRLPTLAELEYAYSLGFITFGEQTSFTIDAASKRTEDSIQITEWVADPVDSRFKLDENGDYVLQSPYVGIYKKELRELTEPETHFHATKFGYSFFTGTGGKATTRFDPSKRDYHNTGFFFSSLGFRCAQ